MGGFDFLLERLKGETLPRKTSNSIEEQNSSEE